MHVGQGFALQLMFVDTSCCDKPSPSPRPLASQADLEGGPGQLLERGLPTSYLLRGLPIIYISPKENVFSLYDNLSDQQTNKTQNRAIRK